MPTSYPPRARRPETEPSGQLVGNAGNRLISPAWLCSSASATAAVMPLPRGEASIHALPGCWYQTTLSPALAEPPTSDPTHKTAEMTMAKKRRGYLDIAPFINDRRQQCPDRC